MTQAHGMKVASVESRHLGHAESLGNGDDRGVGGAEREVGVGVDQVGHAFVVGEFEVDDGDSAGRELRRKFASTAGPALRWRR